MWLKLTSEDKPPYGCRNASISTKWNLSNRECLEFLLQISLKVNKQSTRSWLGRFHCEYLQVNPRISKLEGIGGYVDGNEKQN
jgi:hypothetical protein